MPCCSCQHKHALLRLPAQACPVAVASTSMPTATMLNLRAVKHVCECADYTHQHSYFAGQNMPQHASLPEEMHSGVCTTYGSHPCDPNATYEAQAYDHVMGCEEDDTMGPSPASRPSLAIAIGKFRDQDLLHLTRALSSACYCPTAVVLKPC